MTIHPQKALTGCALFAIIATVGLLPAWADDLDSIRYGEAARTYRPLNSDGRRAAW